MRPGGLLEMATNLKEALETWADENPLRRKRNDLGLSILAAAARLGVSPSAVQQWESGAQTPARDDSWTTLREFCGTTVERRWREWLAARPS